MKEYKKLHLKNDDDSDRLIDHLNQGWELFREFTGWVIVCKFFADAVSPAAEPEKPIIHPDIPEPAILPHRKWLEMLKEPLRSQALYTFDKYPRDMCCENSTCISDALETFHWIREDALTYWNGVFLYFRGVQEFDHKYLDGWASAKACAPDGWEQQGAGE